MKIKPIQQKEIKKWGKLYLKRILLHAFQFNLNIWMDLNLWSLMLVDHITNVYMTNTHHYLELAGQIEQKMTLRVAKFHRLVYNY